MRPSLRFLGLVMVGWVGLRSMMLGAIPGGEMFRLKANPAAAPPIVATEFAPIDAPSTAFEVPPPLYAATPAPPVVLYRAPPPAYYATLEALRPCRYLRRGRERRST